MADPIAVVGVGVVTPVGSDPASVWAGLVSGRSAFECIDVDGEPGLRAIVARASDFSAADRIERPELRRTDRLHHLVRCAADDAVACWGGVDAVDPDRFGILVGIGHGPSATIDDQYRSLHDRGWRGLSPLALPATMPNAPAAMLSLRTGARGPTATVATACASSATAIGEAMWLLRTGRCDVVLAGGGEAMITRSGLSFFSRMDALSRRFDDLERASCPFDASRDGFVMAEGAAFLVLERVADARANHRDIAALLVGYGTSSDAHHLVAPREDGAGAAAAMLAAVADAGAATDDVVQVNAHGTSTPRNDHAEAAAIASTFRRRPPVVTAPKGVLGHMIGGAGATEAVATLLSIAAGVVPPVGGLREVDPACEIDLATEPRACTGLALSNSFAFGGHNVSLAITAA